MHRYSSSLKTFFRFGWPVLALIAMIAAAALGLLQNVAREQDEAYQINSQNLMHQSLQALVRSNAQISTDYGLWDDAYNNITLADNKEWMQTNYYSSISSAIAVVRPKSKVRFLAVVKQFQASTPMIEESVQSLDFSSHATYLKTKHDIDARVAPQGLISIDGHIGVIAVEPIRPDTGNSGARASVLAPVDFIVSIKFIDVSAVTELARSINLQNPTMVIGTAEPPVDKDSILFAVKDISGAPIAWIKWKLQRPGSQAFARRIIPIAIGLFVLGFLVIYVIQIIVARQIQLLELARQSAEEASKAKSTFLANISHELRTPLNAIIGYSELMAEDYLEAANAVGTSDAQKVTRAGHHLLALINDLLDHSKIEAGKMDLNPTTVALIPIVEDVVEALRARAGENGTRIVITCDPLLGNAFLDGMRLKQCLLNLVSNAAKFTQGGTISVMARPVGYKGADGVRFSVKDTGIGMSAATLKKLFMPFVQADETTAQRFGGTGLGLVITQRLIEAMGGSVSVESIDGQGSCFTLFVPRGMAWSGQNVTAASTEAIAA